MTMKPRTNDPGVEGPAPEWVGALMPHQRYAEILDEIKKLQEEAEQSKEAAKQAESMGRLLWQTGHPLAETVRDVFRGVGLHAELTPPGSAHDVTVSLDDQKRLLVQVTGTQERVTKSSPKVRRAFDAAQDIVGDDDRLVLAANVYRERPVADREWLDPAPADALMIITGLGAVFVTTVTLFRIWKMSTKNPAAALEYLRQMHDAPAGLFALEGAPTAEQPSAEKAESHPEGSPRFLKRLVGAW